MRNLSQEVYAKIYFDMINMLKEDPILKKSINKNEIQFIEQTWCKKLQESNILVNEDLRASNFLATLKMTSNSYFDEINRPFTNINQLMDAQYLKNRKEKKIFLVQDRKTGKIHLKSNIKREEIDPKKKFNLKKEAQKKKEKKNIKKEEKNNKKKDFNLKKENSLKIKKENSPKIKKETLKTPEKKAKTLIKKEENYKISLSHLKEDKIPNKKSPKKKAEQKIEESDEDLFTEENTSKKTEKILDYKKILKKEKLNKLMEKKIEEVLKFEKIKKEENFSQSEIVDEEELNSDDDITDYDEDINTGNNLLLAYYEKFSRKKDKRKILMKNCVLRVEEMDFIFPVVKGDFLWIAAKDDFY